MWQPTPYFALSPGWARTNPSKKACSHGLSADYSMHSRSVQGGYSRLKSGLISSVKVHQGSSAERTIYLPLGKYLEKGNSFKFIWRGYSPSSYPSLFRQTPKSILSAIVGSLPSPFTSSAFPCSCACRPARITLSIKPFCSSVIPPTTPLNAI
jgi:hypothetical protein